MLRFKYIVIASLLLFSACRKDSITFTPYPASIGEINYFLQGVINEQTVTTFTLKGGAVVPDTTLTTPGGVRVFLANTEFLLVNAAGETVPMSSCQQIKIIITEVLDKGDWMARGLPTVAAGGQVIDHTGAVYLRIICDGKEVGLAENRYVKIQIPAPVLQNNLSLEYLQPSTDNHYGNWEPGENNAVFWAEWAGTTPGTTVSGYELLLKRTGWATAGVPLQAPSYSNYCVALPLQFDGDNTRVFMSFDDQRTIAEMKSVDGSSRFCLENTPLGYSVRLITISKAGPTYWLGNQKTETASDATYKLTPEEKTAAQINDFIKGL